MKQTTKEIFKLFTIFLEKFEKIGLIRDNLTEDEVTAIYNLLDTYQYLPSGLMKQQMILVDLRCWVGMMTVLLNEVRGECDGKVFAIDDFNRENRFDTRYLNIKNICEDNIRNVGAWESVKLIEKNPVIASQDFKDQSIDVLFFNNIVDYNEIRDNINVWYPKVKSGGLIFGRYCETLDAEGINDFRGDEHLPFNLHLGIIKAIKEIFPTIYHIEKANIWYVYKG